MTRWDQLLEVQRLDTTADQLRHRSAHLPERARLAELAAERSALDAKLAEVGARSDELGRAQRKLEDEITSLNDKAAQIDRALYSGTVTIPKDLQAMQSEIEHIRSRVSHLEDQELELMETAEPVDAELAARQADRQRIDDEVVSVTTALEAADAAIQAELREAEAARAEAASAVSAELLAEYDRLRARLDGIAVAPLHAGACGGCHLKLSAVELDRIRNVPPDDAVYCEECGRLLVRT